MDYVDFLIEKYGILQEELPLDYTTMNLEAKKLDLIIRLAEIEDENFIYA